jgi:hypothetical protein
LIIIDGCPEKSSVKEADVNGKKKKTETTSQKRMRENDNSFHPAVFLFSLRFLISRNMCSCGHPRKNCFLKSRKKTS